MPVTFRDGSFKGFILTVMSFLAIVMDFVLNTGQQSSSLASKKSKFERLKTKSFLLQ